MQRPGQDPVAKDDVPWWMKYAGRGLGTVGSISMFCNITCIVRYTSLMELIVRYTSLVELTYCHYFLLQ